MKRDIDLARQLLLDIEARGADCSVSVLRTSADHDAEERVRYHLRLLIDAGYLKEIDRTANGVPCLRLTDAGHELIELSRSESQWQHAKHACHERTGGLALTVVRALLVAWATAPQPRRYGRRYRPAFADSLLYEPSYREYRPAPVDDFDDYEHRSPYEPVAHDWDYMTDEPVNYAPREEQVRYVRVRPKHRNAWRPHSRPRVSDLAAEAGGPPASSLPEHLI